MSLKSNYSPLAYLRRIVERSAQAFHSKRRQRTDRAIRVKVSKAEGKSAIEALVEEMKRTYLHRLAQSEETPQKEAETRFFRDVHPFRAMSEKILPHLIESRRQSETLTILCCGCSTGQEAISIAIVIRERFPMLSNWNLKIIGLDRSPEKIEFAKRGIYSEEMVSQGLSTPILVHYFHRHGTHWRVNDDLLKMITYIESDIAHAFPPNLPKVDLLLVRNVLPAYSPDMQTRFLNKLHQIMKPDGFAFLGVDESIQSLDVRFDKQQIHRTVFYQPR